jgi:hypothetical protein
MVIIIMKYFYFFRFCNFLQDHPQKHLPMFWLQVLEPTAELYHLKYIKM